MKLRYSWDILSSLLAGEPFKMRIVCLIVLVCSSFLTHAANLTLNQGPDGSTIVGPIESTQLLNDLSMSLERHDLDYRVQDAGLYESLGYIVVTAPYPSRSAAAEDLDRLAAAGERDYLFVGRGDYLGRISAGVFSVSDAAESRASGLNRSGFQFQVIERKRKLPASEIVVEASWPDSEQLRRIVAGEMVPLPVEEVPEVVAEPEPEPEPETARTDIETPVMEARPVDRPAETMQPSNETTARAPEEVEPPTSDSAAMVLESVSEPVTEPLPIVDNAVDETPGEQSAAPVSVQQPEVSAGPPLWVIALQVLIAFLVGGLLVFFYLRRNTTENLVPTLTLVDQQDEQEPIVQQIAAGDVINDYAQSLLTGHAEPSRQLAIFGTDEHRSVRLIQDLMYLQRLNEGAETNAPFALDCQSFIEGFIADPQIQTKYTSDAGSGSELPPLLILDAEKFGRILQSLMAYAAERAVERSVSLHVSFESDQLETQVVFESAKVDDVELSCLVDPSRDDSDLTLSERVGFQTVQKLSGLVGGELTTSIDGHKVALVFVMPAKESEKVKLPPGQTINTLQQSRDIAEQKQAEANDLLESLKARLATAVSEHQDTLSQLQQDKDKAAQELEAVGTELAQAQAKLQQELEARAKAESDAKGRMSELESELKIMRQEVDRESEALRQNEEAALNQVQALEEQMSSMQNAMDQESQQALELLREQLSAAEKQLADDSRRREEAEQRSEEKVSNLRAEVDAAHAAAEQAKYEKHQQENALKETRSKLEQSRDDLRERLDARQEEVRSARAEAEQLREALSTAIAEVEHERSVRDERLQIAQQEIENLQATLEEARQSSASDIAAQTQRVEEASEEIERLKQSVAEAEAQAEQAPANREAELQDEIRSLKQELAQASERLEGEVERRNQAENAAGSHIGSLIDELNETRATDRDQREEFSAAEELRMQKIAALTDELDVVRSDLKVVHEENRALKSSAEEARALAEAQTDKLESAIKEQEAAAALSSSAKKVAKHLKAKVAHLEGRLSTLKEELKAKPSEVNFEPAEPVAIEAEPDGDTDSSVRFAPEPEVPQSSTLELTARESFEPQLALSEQATPQSATPESATPEAALPEPALPESAAAEPVAPEPALTEDNLDFELDDFDDSDTAIQVSTSMETRTIDDTPSGSSESVESPAVQKVEPAAELSSAPVGAFDEADEEPDEPEGLTFQFDDKPIRSSISTTNPILQAMIGRFVDELLTHLDEMESAHSNRQYMKLLASCNWIRAEATTLGFEILHIPIRAIEKELRRRRFSQIITHLAELRNIAERIEYRKPRSNGPGIRFVVPEDAKDPLIYEKFVAQLGKKLLELEVAAKAGYIRQMKQLCRWVNRYAGQIQFEEVIEANDLLLAAINAEDQKNIVDQLKAFALLYTRIEVVSHSKAPRSTA